MSSNLVFVGDHIFDKTNNVTIYIIGNDLTGYDPKWNDNYDQSETDRKVIYLN